MHRGIGDLAGRSTNRDDAVAADRRTRSTEQSSCTPDFSLSGARSGLMTRPESSVDGAQDADNIIYMFSPLLEVV